MVLDRLTYQQQAFAKSNQAASLDHMDLAALLRILDQNWFEISRLHNFPSTARNWIKEAQNLRNRWAHAPSSGLDDHDIYRDLDTVERLALVLGASEAGLATLREEKAALLATMAGSASLCAIPPEAASSAAFKPGTVVRLKAKPSITGAIIAHLPGDPEDRYQVFHDATVATYYTSQLEAVAITPARASVPPPTLLSLIHI